MGTFEYTHERIRLEFSVRQDGTLGVTDFGRGSNANGNEGALAEIQLSGENHLNHHFGKHCASSESRSLKYESRRIEKTEKGEKLIIVQKNDRIEVETLFEFFDGVNGYRVSNRVTGLQPVVLEFVSSFNAMAIEGMNSDWAENTDVIFVHNYWQGECQLKRYNLRELGLYKVADFSSKKISLSNVGTWSTMEYLPMCVVADKNGSGCFSVQLEGVAAWGLEIGTLEKSIYLNTYGPCSDLHSWAKKLEKGESYSTPATVVCFGKDEEDVFGVITAYRRAVRRYRLTELPSVFNDYMHCLDTDTTEEKEIPLIDCAGELGCKYYMIDAGWFSDGFWYDNTGVWFSSKERYPNGLRNLTDYIRKKGMIPGLWIEPEVMSIGLEFGKNLPDDWFFIRNGRRVIDNSRYMLDFSNPAVREYATQAVERMIDEYGAGYIKFDHNINGGVGTEIACNTPGEGLERHIRSYIGWITSLFERFPDVVFENCASGGLRMDYGFLDKCAMQSVSDQTDYLKNAAIAANCAVGIAPEQAGMWSVPLADCDSEQAAFNGVNGILTRIYQSGRADLIDKECFALLKEAIEVNKRLAPLIETGRPIWPIGFAEFDSKVMAYGTIGNEGGALCVWNRDNKDVIVIDLSKYNVCELELLYPEKLKTVFSFSKVDGLLKIYPHTDNFARCFSFSVSNTER